MNNPTDEFAEFFGMESTVLDDEAAREASAREAKTPPRASAREASPPSAASSAASQPRTSAGPKAPPQCDHSGCFDTDDESVVVCKKCGCVVEQIDFSAEWRFYGAADSRSAKDPSRCHRSKDGVRGNISKVFADARLGHIPLSIQNKTEILYRKIVGDETVRRGGGRKAIVAACLFFVYKHEGNIRTSEEISRMFGLTKQEMSKGLTRYHMTFPEDRNKIIKPMDLVKRVMTQAKISASHYKYIYRIAQRLDGVDPVLTRSSPKAVASAIVYLYVCLMTDLRETTGLTKTKFAQSVDLSEITITKLVKTTAELVGEEVDV